MFLTRHCGEVNRGPLAPCGTQTILRAMNRVRVLFQIAALALLAGCAPSARQGIDPEPLQVSRGGPHLLTTLVLSPGGPAEGQHAASFAAAGAGRVSVGFLPQGRGAYDIRATCDARARVRDAQGEISAPMWREPGQPVVLRVEPGARAAVLLDLDPATTRCELTVTPGGRSAWSLRLEREDRVHPAVARLDTPLPACTAAGGDALERAFMADLGLSATCPVQIGRVSTLEHGLDALNARIEALTGRRLTQAQLEAGDPDMAIDYSAAPQLDLIYMTYLNLNADFAGFLMARMLAWHAARGTVVRILVAEIMLTATDRRLFEGLAARYPNVQIQSFTLPASAAVGLDGQLGRLHRVTHVKMFATLARQPGRSVAIIGGRNIHEGYFFDAPRNLRGYPGLHQYNVAETRLTGGFTAYQDYEIAMHDDAAVRRIAGHMAALWHRDHDSQVMRAPASGGGPARAGEGMMRHFVSIPFADGQAQEAYYVGLFDAARSSIRIAIPYLNLPPLLHAALDRARARGVEVDVVTTVRVREATDFIVSGLNRDFANQFGDWVEFVDFDPYPLLLHAKLIVIDGRLSVIGSTNLNQRSFVHDMENGVVVMDRALAASLDATISRWMARGEQRGPGQPVSAIARMLMRIGFVRRVF